MSADQESSKQSVDAAIDRIMAWQTRVGLHKPEDPSPMAMPVVRFAVEWLERHQFAHMLTEAVGRLVTLPQLDAALQPALKLLEEVDGKQYEPNAAHTRHVEHVAGLAKTEIDAGYANLAKQATIVAWSSLEVALEDAAIAFCVDDTDAVDQHFKSSLKVPLGFSGWSPHDRGTYLVKEIDRSDGGPRPPGVAAWKTVLSIFGAYVPPDDDLRRDLLELSQVRHILVHRGGRADARFVTLCPWLASRPGRRVTPTIGQYYRWEIAGLKYMTLVAERLEELGRAHARPLPESDQPRNGAPASHSPNITP